MKIIVDTNIIFSALLNSKGLIGRLLFYPQKPLRFYSCEFLKAEIKEHEEKFLKISGMTEKELDTSRSKIFNKLKFIDHQLINDHPWEKAQIMVKNIDPDDVSFVALALDIQDSYLWTGDKKLRDGLRKRGFKQILNTQELVKLIENINEE